MYCASAKAYQEMNAVAPAQLALSRRSYRFWLIVPTILGEILVAAFILYLSLQTLENSLREEISQHANHLASIFKTAIPNEHFTRKRNELEQTLDQIRSTSDVDYLILLDKRGSILAQSGWTGSRALPTSNLPENASDQTWLDYRIDLPGEAGVSLLYGLDLNEIGQMRTQLLWQTGLIVSLGVVLSTALLFWLGLVHTRRLTQIETMG